MDYKKCEYPECTELAMCTCECRETPAYLCLHHLVHHFKSRFSLNHIARNLYSAISEKEIGCLLEAKSEYLKHISRKIQDLSLKYKQRMEKINRDFLKEFEKLKVARDKLTDLIENGIYSQMVPKSKQGNILEKLIRRESTKNYSEFTFYNSVIKSLKYLDEDKSHNKTGRYLYYFEANTKNLIQVDNETEKAQRIKIDSLPENFGNRSGNCVLEDGTLFYCGGQNSNVMRSSYIIDPWSKEWIKLADMPQPNYEITALLHKNQIYVVGGYTGSQNLNTFYKYSLDKNKWKTLSNIPVSSNSVYSIVCDDHLLFAGYQTSGIYSYSFSKKRFQKVFDGSSNGYCVLLRLNEYKAFALFNSAIYKCHSKDIKKWKRMDSFTPNLDFPDSSPQLYGDWFNFKEYNMKPKRFNYKTLQVEEIDFDIN